MSGPPPAAGFDQHVWGQLNDIASVQSQQTSGGRGRGRGSWRGSRGRGRGGPALQPVQIPHQFQHPTSFQSPPPSLLGEAFPPLGTQASPVPSPYPSSPSSAASFTRPQSRGNPIARPTSRGSYGQSSGQFSPLYQQQNFHMAQANNQQRGQSWDEYRRPPAPAGNLYQPTQTMQSMPGPFGRQDATERAFRQQIMMQSDYLNDVQRAARQKYSLKQEEQLLKEGFRKKMENNFQSWLLSKYPSIDVTQVRLKCYGSLNNGFGMTNCDMDLLLVLPTELDFINKSASSPPTEVPKDEGGNPAVPNDNDEHKFEVALLIEGHLLDAGIGARLLTKTRVPIMKICEKPSESLLENLRSTCKENAEAALAPQPRMQKEILQTPPEMTLLEIKTALSELSLEDDAAQVSLPDSPTKSKPLAVEFVGDCGIQCDLNFTNFVAVHNTKLLRTYCEYDSRVAEIGTFIKHWAKTRDINTPYLGTLSSYGYILMVLHYLINVVDPPVIPNLQQGAHTEDSWGTPSAPMFEDKYDIRFWHDPQKLQNHRAFQKPNRQSTGHLLRGFFWYYSAKEGFHWTQEVISIRSPRGIVRKAAKGWTEAKWSEQNKNVRQRYLLAIEDPFELDHNVARVVGHNGIVAIRDEFRRAWNIISSIGDPSVAGSVGDLLEPFEGRGDLLRKDQDHHRARMKKMQQEADAKHRQALQDALVSSDAAGAAPKDATAEESHQLNTPQTNGTSSRKASRTIVSSPPAQPFKNHRSPKNTKLTNGDCAIQDKRHQLKGSRMRRVMVHSDDEDDKADTSGMSPNLRSTLLSEGKQHTETVSRECDEDEPIYSAADMCASQGYDVNGKPIAWDLSVQDGRWLQWRDNKIRNGTWRGAQNAQLVELDAQYPYDPKRPSPENSREYSAANELYHVNQAPFPLNKVTGVTSTTTAIDANLVKPWREVHVNEREQRKQRRTKTARRVLNTDIDEEGPKTENPDAPRPLRD